MKPIVSDILGVAQNAGSLAHCPKQ